MTGTICEPDGSTLHRSRSWLPANRTSRASRSRRSGFDRDSSRATRVIAAVSGDGAGPVDQEVADDSRAQDEAADGAERLAAGVQGDDVVAALEISGEAASLRTEHAGRMRLVDHHHGLVAIGDREQFGEVRAVAIHAVEAFDRQPGPPGASGGAPADDRRVERIDIVVRHPDKAGPAPAKSLVHAGMDQFIVDDQIAGLRQGREDREIGDIAATEIQGGLGAEIAGRFRLQCLMLWMIAAQQT